MMIPKFFHKNTFKRVFLTTFIGGMMTCFVLAKAFAKTKVSQTNSPSQTIEALK